jgi:hypothetical protein
VNDRSKDRIPEPDQQAAVAFAPAPIARRPRRRLDLGVVALIASIVLVGVAVVRPWGDTGHGPTALTGPLPSTPAPSEPPAASETAPSTTARSSAASPVPTIGLARLATERVIRDPAGHAESWGLAVGAGTHSPDGLASYAGAGSVISLAVDSWSVWSPLEPKASSMPAPGASPKLPGGPASGLCQGLPDLPSGAQVVALTAPGLPRDYLQILGWQVVGWHDEPRDFELLPATRELTTYNVGAISELSLPNGGPWPDGRYELLVGGIPDYGLLIDGSPEYALTFCLGRP